MPSAAFNESVNYDVTSMHIIGTNNTFIPNKLHQKFPQLTNLRIELSDMTSLFGNDTEGLQNLKNLYLGKNSISNVGADAFQNLTKLNNLYLNDNLIQQLPNSIFQKLTNLERIWLNDNHLTSLHLELLSENKNLNRIYLQNNKLLIIAEETFHLPNLEVVDLRGNVCINRWTFDTPLHTVKRLAHKSCNPSVENMRRSSILMAKLIHELSVRDVALNKKIYKQDEIIFNLRIRLSQYEELDEDLF